MKMLVGVICYDRLKNLQRWLHAWDFCDKPFEAELAIVLNETSPFHTMGATTTKLLDMARKYGPHMQFVRKNEGFDIGALRQLIREPLKWDVLFWATDDNIPMRKDFLTHFALQFAQPNMNIPTGLVGNQWVPGTFYKWYKPHTVYDHFRTSCFAISRQAAEKLYFPDKLETKEDCWMFEWGHPTMNLTKQILDNGFRATGVSETSTKDWLNAHEYVWDSGCPVMYKYGRTSWDFLNHKHEEVFGTP